jgi:hypothetical protein
VPLFLRRPRRRCCRPTSRKGLARNAIAFPDGIPGFEACRQFVLLASEAIAPLQRLESIEGTPAAFVGIDPRLALADYRCRLSDNDLRALEPTPRRRCCGSPSSPRRPTAPSSPTSARPSSSTPSA